MARELRMARIANQIAQSTLEEGERLFADAELTGDDETIRAAGYARLKRLREASDRDKGQVTSAARNTYIAFQQEFDAWRWNEYWVPLDVVIEFKRGVYERALTELSRFLPRVHPHNRYLRTGMRPLRYEHGAGALPTLPAADPVRAAGAPPDEA